MYMYYVVSKLSQGFSQTQTTSIFALLYNKFNYDCTFPNIQSSLGKLRRTTCSTVNTCYFTNVNIIILIRCIIFKIVHFTMFTFIASTDSHIDQLQLRVLTLPVYNNITFKRTALKIVETYTIRVVHKSTHINKCSYTVQWE